MRERKILYVLCLLGVIALNCMYIESQFFIMLMIIALVPLISCLIYFASKIRLRLLVMVKDKFITKGDELAVNVKVSSGLGVKLPCSKLGMQMNYSNCDDVSDFETSMGIFDVKKGAKDIRFVAKHCGIVNVYIKRLEIRDFLQMCNTEYEYSLTRRAVVFPEKIDMSRDKFYLDTDDECRALRQETDNTEIMELKTYADGDALNKIHWKLSMSGDDLIVKHYGEEIERHTNIVVDLTRYMENDFRDNLDLIYQAAYSVASHFCEMSVSARFVVWNEDEEDILFMDFDDEDSLKESMQQLMMLRCTSGNLTQLDREISARGDEFMYDETILITQCEIKSEDMNVINVKDSNLYETLGAIA